MAIDFFAATYFEDTLTIRLQNMGTQQAFADGVFIEVRNVEHIADTPGSAVETTLVPSIEEFITNGPIPGDGSDSGAPKTAYDSPLRASLYLNDTCPENHIGFSDGQGTIVFDNIYHPDGGDRIRGSLDLQFIDPRTWESPTSPGDHAEITGDFDFKLSRTRPGQTFL